MYAQSIGFLVKGLDFSPIKGPEGNIEYLVFLEKQEEPVIPDTEQMMADIKMIVKKAHEILG